MSRQRSSRRVSTRRAKMAEKKARRNIVVAIILAVILMGIFLFVIMPIVFEVAINFARNNHTGDGILTSDTIPPQKPAFQPPEEFTNEEKLTINGFTEPAAKVELIVDSLVFSETVADEQGAFSFEESLEAGEHQVQVKAMDDSKNESVSSSYPVTVDVTAPSLNISNPQDETTYTLRSEKVLTIEGAASEKGTVYVNGSLVFTDEDGNFTSSYSLGDGDNEIEIVAEDQAGNKSETTKLTIYYRP